MTGCFQWEMQRQVTKTSYKDKDKYCDSTKYDSMNGITCAEKAVKDPNYFKDLYKNYRK